MSRWQRLIDNLAELARVPSRIVAPVATVINVELQKEFSQATDPYGTPWVPIRPSTVRKKGGSTLIMIDTGKMRRETRAIALPGAGIALVTVEYTAFHQERSGSRPARPVLPYKKDLPVVWSKAIGDEWAKAFKRTMER